MGRLSTLECTYLPTSYNYKRFEIPLSIQHPMFLTEKWNVMYNNPIYSVI